MPWMTQWEDKMACDNIDCSCEGCTCDPCTCTPDNLCECDGRQIEGYSEWWVDHKDDWKGLI